MSRGSAAPPSPRRAGTLDETEGAVQGVHGYQRALALAGGRGDEAAELDTEIETSTHAFVGAAVTEIATLMGELDGPLQG